MSETSQPVKTSHKTQTDSNSVSKENRRNMNQNSESWLSLKKFKFVSTPNPDNSVSNDIITPKNESKSPSEDKARSKLDGVSKRVSGIAATIKSTTSITEDVFYPHKAAPKSNEKASNESKDIFSASLSEVFLELGKDTIGLIKKPVLPSFTKNPLKNLKLPTSSTNQTIGKNKLPEDSIKRKKSISDILEIDKDTVDSSIFSSYHLDNEKIRSEDEYPNNFSEAVGPSIVNGITITGQKRNSASSENAPVSFSTKVQFMESLTEMPEELMDTEQFNSLPDEDDDVRAERPVQPHLTYDEDDYV